MTVTVPDTIVEATHLTPEQALVDVAIGIYKREQMSLAKCAKMVGMTRLEFQQELGKRKISINYDVDDLERDVATLKEVFGNG